MGELKLAEMSVEAQVMKLASVSSKTYIAVLSVLTLILLTGLPVSATIRVAGAQCQSF